MSCDYHNRVDFRAFDVMVSAIDNATKEEIKNAMDTARKGGFMSYNSPSKRAIWQAFEKLLRKQLKKY